MEALHRYVWPYLKAYAALIGSICTALLAVYTEDTSVGHWLTVIGIVATTIATWAVPNTPDPNAPPNRKRQHKKVVARDDRRHPDDPAPGPGHDPIPGAG